MPIASRRQGPRWLGPILLANRAHVAAATVGGRRRSSARIFPHTNGAAMGAMTASLRGRAHQGVAATPAEAGTTGGGGLVSQTLEAGGPGENLAVLGVPWLPFKCQQQATPSMPSPTSATHSRSGLDFLPPYFPIPPPIYLSKATSRVG